jgi:CubicO group peptidase (beta-lactamase class C family)
MNLIPETKMMAIGVLTLMTMALVPAAGLAANVESATTATVQPETVGFSSERLAKLKTAFQTYVDSGRLAGAGFMVVRHGKVAVYDTVGYQDIAARKAFSKDAIVRGASMTKPVTAVAMMILYEEGKWQLDDAVAKHIPEFAGLRVMTEDGQVVESAHAMTMRELVTNSGGIGDTGADAHYARNIRVNQLYAAANLRDGSACDMVQKIASIPLSFQPGTDFQYGLSQDVQGCIIERLSGLSFDGFLRTRIFAPLGMRDTDFRVPADKLSRLAQLYDYGPDGKLTIATGPFSQVPTEMPKYLSGGGGLFTTMADYQRFSQMLLNRGDLNGARILAPSSVALLSSNLLPQGVTMRFSQVKRWEGQGYGVDVGVIVDSGHASFSSGMPNGSYYWGGAHGTFFWIDPVNDIIVIGVTQQKLAGIAQIGLDSPAPDPRALSKSLVYAAFVDPSK